MMKFLLPFKIIKAFSDWRDKAMMDGSIDFSEWLKLLSVMANVMGLPLNLGRYSDAKEIDKVVKGIEEENKKHRLCVCESSDDDEDEDDDED